MKPRESMFLSAMLCCFLYPLLTGAQSQAKAGEEEAVSMIRQIYKEVSRDGKTLPDWDRIRTFFVEEAVIVLKTSRDGSTQFNLEGFIQDFKDFYEAPAMDGSGFTEEVIELRSNVYKDIAFIGVVYEASIRNSERPPQKGIDFWLLTLKKEGWKVVAVTNESLPPGASLPPPFN